MLAGLMSRWTMPRECVRDLPQHAQRLRDGKPPAALEPLPQRLARDVRHDVVEEVSARAGREDRENVRVLETGGELYLALKARCAHLA